MVNNIDIKSERSNSAEVARQFCDMHPPLNAQQAKIESSRCYFCHDAPCIEACPTDIDIPNFIKKIHSQNTKGAAIEILNQNIMGGTCARVCPVESLCEQACVRNSDEDKPVVIGELQRYATDWLFEKNIQPYTRAASTGKKIAVVGAGPAGLSCAHLLSRQGHDVEIFEAKAKPGGLNEYGLAAYKVVDDFVQKEIKFILELGGIRIHYNQRLGDKVSLAKLRQDYDAVFLGMGLSGVNELQIDNEELPGVIDAVDYISKLRQTENLNELPVGRRILVIGGGSTAIDIATQTKKLGAEFVTLVYRRGEDDMKATSVERRWAQTNGVLIKTWAKPSKLIGSKQGVRGVVFERTQADKNGKLQGTGETFELEADQVFKAIGQTLIPSGLQEEADSLNIESGRILVDKERRTNLSDVFAGGDCINGGHLTVTSVQDGKLAATAIHKLLTQGSEEKAYG